MRKQFSLLALMAMLAALPGRTEVLETDLSIFGMD